MVASRRIAFILPILLLTFLSLSLVISSTEGQTVRYHLEHEYAKLWVNTDGSIDLLYDIDIACDQGSFSQVFVGQPKDSFTLGVAFDSNGNSLSIAKDMEQGPAVQVSLSSPLSAGNHVQFNLTTNVQGMVYLDNTNPGNVGLQFIPSWWDEAVMELRVLIVLPAGATSNNVRNTPDYDNILTDPETGNLMLYWQRLNLAPNDKFTVGVSFPKELVSQYQVQRTGWEAFVYDFLLPNAPIIGAGVILFVVIVLVVRNAAKKRPYEKPRLKIESLGVRRGLTAVEAAWLLGLGPVKIVVAMLYGLMQKRAVWVTESEPKLKLEVQPEFRDASSTKDLPIRYYEHRFIDSVKDDGTLDENGLASAVALVRDTVEEKMRGYNRQENVKYYQGIAEQAWKQVEGAGTPELASTAFDENLLWLYMDADFGNKFKGTLGNQVFIPDPAWWWYWWWARPDPHPPMPGTGVPTGGEIKPQPLPGGEFADKVVSSLEKSANGLVTNLEKFADSIAPAKAEPSRSPARRGSGGVCACANCACACACVSCACACAGGRVR
jgi:hypothetical protein